MNHFLENTSNNIKLLKFVKYRFLRSSVTGGGTENNAEK